MLRRLLLVALSSLAVIALAGPAAAQDDYTPDIVVTVTDPQPSPCQVVVVTGTGFQPGEEVPILVGGTQVATVVADANGIVTYEYQVPCDAVGSITITVGNTIVVVEVAGTQVAQPLPTTGSGSTGPLTRAGVLLVAGGGLLVAGARTRRSDEHG